MSLLEIFEPQLIINPFPLTNTRLLDFYSLLTVACPRGARAQIFNALDSELSLTFSYLLLPRVPTQGRVLLPSLNTFPGACCPCLFLKPPPSYCYILSQI